MKTKKINEQIVNEINDSQLFINNEEWISSNTFIPSRNFIIYDDPTYYPEYFIKQVERFDNNVNPFMNKLLVMKNYKYFASKINLELQEDGVNISIPALNMNMQTIRKVNQACKIDYALQFKFNMITKEGHNIEIIHEINSCGNSFYIKDNEKRLFESSILFQDENAINEVMNYLEAANNILEEKFIPLVKYDISPKKTRKRKK